MNIIDKKKYIVAGIQIAILIIAYWGVWGYSVVVAGVIGILLQAFLHLRYVGWIAAIGYPLTYWISSLCDTPTDGNLFVYWVFSYVGVIIISLAVDLILKKR